MEKGRLIIDGVDVSGSVGSAASVPYSNTNSGLEATNAQGAIDELATSVTELNSNIDNLFCMKETEIDNFSISKSSVSNGCTLDVSLEGYKPISIINWGLANASNSGANNNNCIVYGYYLVKSTDEVIFNMRNKADSTAKIKVKVQVLYIKESLFEKMVTVLT